jgi:DNA-binding transcriptional ArsR family regulator
MKTSDFFKVLSNEVRIKIFKMLLRHEKRVSEIVSKLSVAQPTVTQHLKILKTARLVKSRKEGCSIYYSANEAGLKSMRKVLRKVLKDIQK